VTLTVVVTRPAPRDHLVVSLLTVRGARVLRAPSIRCVAIETPPAPVRDHYDWVAISSPTAAELVPTEWLALAPRVAAIGPGTSASLAMRGFETPVMASTRNARGLAAVVGGDAVLHPVSDRARPEFREALEARGVAVDEPIFYRTESVPIPAEIREALASGEVDSVLFASPSAASSFYDALSPDARNAAVAVAIGPTTAARLKSLGVRRVRVAAEASEGGMVAAVFAGENE